MDTSENVVTELENQILTGERALFQGHDLRLRGMIFSKYGTAYENILLTGQRGEQKYA